MTTKLANAYPRKHFFLEMFTRDISLEDCVLDLIDNSIDGLIRSRGIDITSSILAEGAPSTRSRSGSLPKIEVSYSGTEFKIDDTCGGIRRKDALGDVFNFGHAAGQAGGTLGVYGIGLKRAIFKIGNHFEMESRTVDDGFTVDLDMKEWSEKDDKLEDWKIPLTFISGAPSQVKAGTKIRITDLRPEVVMRVNDGVLAQRLHSTISQTYGLFLNRYLEIDLNGKRVEQFEIPIGSSNEVQAAHDEFEDGDVTVKLFASLAARDSRGQWPAEPAGWYALCNGRIVVAADKTDLTGWGVLGSPVWHAGKYRGFVGVVFFESSNALALPWTTAKRGLNRESQVYQNARNRMKGVAKPILSFLDRMYSQDPPEESFGRNIADHVKTTPLSTVAASAPGAFRVAAPSQRAPKTTVRVQYDAEKSDIEKVKRQVKKHSWGANQVGKFTLLTTT